MSTVRLFFVYVKIGAILLGGGYVILPLMLSEFAEKRQLISQEEIIDYFALSQSLPGIIAANMSMFIGYKLKGKAGAIAGMLGIIFVPFWLIIILGGLLNTLDDNNYVQGVLWGVGIAVIAMIILTVRESWQKSNRDYIFYLIFVLSLIGIIFLKLSPISAITIFTPIGILIKYFQRKVKQ